LADLKESNPIDVAEYAVANGIREEPAFVWWVPHVIEKRDRIICSIGQPAHKKDSKFGIRIPRTWDEAVTLDKAGTPSGRTQSARR
jgi:hypothetical protein